MFYNRHCQKTLDTYIKEIKSIQDLKHRECSKLYHYWDCGLGGGGGAGASHLKAHSGGVKYPGQVAPATGSFILVPPRPMEEVFKVFEPKLVERILPPLSNGTQGGGREPILSGPPLQSNQTITINYSWIYWIQRFGGYSVWS